MLGVAPLALWLGPRSVVHRGQRVGWPTDDVAAQFAADVSITSRILVVERGQRRPVIHTLSTRYPHHAVLVQHVDEFLPLTVGDDLVHELLGTNAALTGQNSLGNVLDNLRYFRWNREPFIPIEFAVAAYRFVHSQVRAGYGINSNFGALLFPDAPSLFVDRNLGDDAAGHKVLNAERIVDWARFNHIAGVEPPAPQGPATFPQEGKKIDGKLSPLLFGLPTIGEGDPNNPRSLPLRNLMRGRAFNLPWGQRVAAAMNAKHILSDDELEITGLGFPRGHTPLWYYILKEADVQHNGEFLGEVGGRIVAEVLLGLLIGDQKSYLANDPSWTPFLPAETAGTFKLGDLFTFADVGTLVPAEPEPVT